MKKRVVLLLLLLALSLAGCNLLPDASMQDRTVSDASIWAMDTQMDLRLYGDTDGTVMAGPQPLRDLAGQRTDSFE